MTKSTQYEIQNLVSSSMQSTNNTAIDEDKNALAKIKMLGVALTTTVLLGGVCMHFLGQVSHIYYLNAWGVDHGLFPKPLDWYSLNGYYALSERTVNLVSTLMSDAIVPVTIGVCILAMIYYFRFLKYLSKKANARKPSNSFNKLPNWLRRFLLDIGITVISTTLIPMSLIFISICLLMPSYIGESRGKAAAEKERQAFSLGCGNPKLSIRCFELKRGKEPVAKGYLIDSSLTHIALYDIDTGKARTFERSGLEMEAE